MRIEIEQAGEGPSLRMVAGRVMNRPLLLHPAKAEVLLNVLEGRLSLDGPAPQLGPEASRFVGLTARDGGAAQLNRVVGGVAIIPVLGSLVNRGAWVGARSGLVSYEGLSAQIDSALSDSAVHSIAFDRPSDCRASLIWSGVIGRRQSPQGPPAWPQGRQD